MDFFLHLFYANLGVIYFLYGISLVIMGIVLTVQTKKHSELEISNILWLLAVFGIVHGISEFLDMWLIVNQKSVFLRFLHWIAVVVSFSFFFEFGKRLIGLSMLKSHRERTEQSVFTSWWLTPSITLIIVTISFMTSDFITNSTIFAQYLLVLPGGIIMGLGFQSYYYMERSRLEPLKMKKFFFGAGIALFIYGTLDGLFGPRGRFFPSNIMNAESFLLTLKVPVELLRALCAIVATWTLTGMIRIFNWEIDNKLKIAQDILKQQLKESEARYMEIVENSSDIIHSVDQENIIVSSNTQGCELLGYRPGELIGKSLGIICSPTTWTALREEFLRVRKEGSAFLESGHLVKKTGGRIDVAIHSIAMFDNKRNFLGMRLTFRDITERKQIEEAFLKSEERYRLLFEESRDAIYLATQEGKFIDINQSGLDLFGYSKEEILDINPNQLYTSPGERIQFQHAIEAKGFVRDYSLQLRKKSGKIMDCMITASLRRSNNGTIIGSQGIIRDITQRRKMEEELQKIEKLESVGIMAGGIAHDFNNILTTIASNISLAKMVAKNDAYLSGMLLNAQKACKHAKNLTNQLLVFSKGGAPIKKIMDLKETLKDSASFALGGSSINSVIEIPDDLWPVEVDKGQIMQVIHNLVINAQQAMPDGGTITVKAQNIPAGIHTASPLKDRDHIQITIQDEGVGIPKEHIKKIFDPFFTTKHDGSGLGLTCTYSIIKKHDGHIDVHSEVGTGTSFEIRLPAMHKKLPAEDKKAEEPVPGSGRILVMDDEENIRTSVGKMLAYLGYEVALARDGDEAIYHYIRAKEAQLPFDAVIMDLTIRGGKGGEETIRKLLEIDPGVKAIVSSGYFNDSVMAEYKKYGFYGVIPKPYEIEELSTILQSIILNTNKVI